MNNEAPPPPPNNSQIHPWSALPLGWDTAVSPDDGRLYYWEKETGRTSWIHPHAMDKSQRGLHSSSPSSPPIVQYPRTSRSFWNGGVRNFWNRGQGAQQQPVSQDMTRTEFLDTPWNASRRPENHQCYSVTALILFFPFGVCALIHSFGVDRAWEAGRYGDAVNHSRQAQNYACFGTGLGFCFWVYWFFFRDGSRLFDFDFDFNFD
jgi:hypothetical protein